MLYRGEEKRREEREKRTSKTIFIASSLSRQNLHEESNTNSPSHLAAEEWLPSRLPKSIATIKALSQLNHLAGANADLLVNI